MPGRPQPDGLLKETECLSGLYWCYRHDEPPEEIQKVVSATADTYPIEA